MPAEAGIQSGGSGGCSPGPPLSRGRRERDAGVNRLVTITKGTFSPAPIEHGASA